MMIRNVISDSVPTNSNNRRINLRARCSRGLIAACTLGYLLSPVQLIP